MNGNITGQMTDLIVLFMPHCSDTETLEELMILLSDRDDWDKAHALFTKIRLKTLNVSKTQNLRAGIQYRFEEICAKTIYNLSYSSAPFDPDSPYWVVPRALAFAKELGISADNVLSITQP